LNFCNDCSHYRYSLHSIVFYYHALPALALNTDTHSSCSDIRAFYDHLLNTPGYTTAARFNFNVPFSFSLRRNLPSSLFALRNI
jgi:hypothetical protein